MTTRRTISASAVCRGTADGITFVVAARTKPRRQFRASARMMAVHASAERGGRRDGGDRPQMKISRWRAEGRESTVTNIAGGSPARP